MSNPSETSVTTPEQIPADLQRLAVALHDLPDEYAAQLAPLVDAVLDAYCQLRPLTAGELESLPLLLRFAALRFWLSRLHDKTFPLSGELTMIKSPDEFRHQLVLRSEAAVKLTELFVPHLTG